MAFRKSTVQNYRVCKTRKCTGRGKKVTCKEEYKFKKVGKPKRVDRTEAKLLIARTAPMLAFMAAESCAHGIFPSTLGLELGHAFNDIADKIKPHLSRPTHVRRGALAAVPRRRRFFFDEEDMSLSEPYGQVYRGVFV